MLKKLTALTAAMATAATMASAGEANITRTDVNNETGSADLCVLDSIGNFSGGATTAIPVKSVGACFDLARSLSNNVPQQSGWRKTQANAMNEGEVVDTFFCRNRSRVTRPNTEQNCFRVN